MSKRLGITALGRRCVLTARSKKDPRLAIGEPIDMHDDFIQCVLDWLERGKTSYEITGPDGKFTISCKREDNDQ